MSELTPEAERIKRAYVKFRSKNRGVTANQIATLAGIHRTTMYGILRGANPPSLASLKGLGAVLGLKVKVL